MSLLSWVLLFLCRNLDSSNGQASSADDGDKGAKKDKESKFLASSSKVDVVILCGWEFEAFIVLHVCPEIITGAI